MQQRVKRGGGGFRRRRRIDRLTRDKATYVDYKDVDLLRRYVDDRGKMIPRRTSGASAKHQRMLRQAIKRARTIALLPYVGSS